MRKRFQNNINLYSAQFYKFEICAKRFLEQLRIIENTLGINNSY